MFYGHNAEKTLFDYDFATSNWNVNFLGLVWTKLTIYLINQVIEIKLPKTKIQDRISVIIDTFGVFAVILDRKTSF